MVHYVDMGESPAIVAKKYGVKVDELMKANNITDPKRVQYGQRLVIPVVAAAQPLLRRRLRHQRRRPCRRRARRTRRAASRRWRPRW